METIAPRPGEELDVEAVRAAVADSLPDAEGELEVRQFGGGHANLTYCLRFASGVEYVLRRPPLGPVAPGSHDMRREYRALSVLYRAFPYAPRAYFFCDDESLIGAPFFVMERRQGVVVRSPIPEIFGGGRDPVANRKLSQVVIDVLAEFHAVDPKPIGLDELGRNPELFLQRQVSGWASRWERSRTHDVPIADEIARWLTDQLPASPPATLLHNDWRLDNMAVAEDDPGRCVAVYDWDMCTLGDPLCDVGTLLSQWAGPGDQGAVFAPMPFADPGFLTRDEAARRYAERSGRSLDGFAFYLVFGTFKMAVVLQQIYFRYHQGQTSDERFAGMRDSAATLFQLAADRRP